MQLALLLWHMTLLQIHLILLRTIDLQKEYLIESEIAPEEDKVIIAEKDRALEENNKRIRELLQRLGKTVYVPVQYR